MALPLISITVLLALLLDRVFGEPKGFHPLVGFGNLAYWLESRLWHRSNKLLAGFLALAVLIAATLSLAKLLLVIVDENLVLQTCLTSILLYFTIAPRSLAEHAEAVSEALLKGDIETARTALSAIVSRDTHSLNEEQISAACCESVLENGSDGIFSALFWFVVIEAWLPGFGIYAAVLYRAVNTLDAMWGYRNERYLYFGWAAAKLDDLMNYIPARLTAFSYGLMGNFVDALSCWQRQGHQWKSSNAGAVMAAGAGSLNVELGGIAVYGGNDESRPKLGLGPKPRAEHIGKAQALVTRTLMLWVVAIIAIESMAVL